METNLRRKIIKVSPSSLQTKKYHKSGFEDNNKNKFNFRLVPNLSFLLLIQQILFSFHSIKVSTESWMSPLNFDILSLTFRPETSCCRHNFSWRKPLTWLFIGSVLIWHIYPPLSSSVTVLMWRFHVLTSRCETLTRGLWVITWSWIAWIAFVSAFTQPTFTRNFWNHISTICNVHDKLWCQDCLSKCFG